MTDDTHTLVVTVDDPDSLYEEGREAIDRLADGCPAETPPTVSFANEEQLTTVFDAETYELLHTIRTEHPETNAALARTVDRPEAAVSAQLDTLASLGVVRLDDHDDGTHPVFPYNDLTVRLFHGDETRAAP